MPRHGPPSRQRLRLLDWLRRWPPLLRRRALLLGVLVAVLALGAMAMRQRIADHLWPEARAQQLRDDAALALARGRLTAADGTGARELYEAALALDPDRNDARAGLQRVAAAALARARAATAAGRFGEAHHALALARELAVPRAAADAVADQLRQREAAVAGIDGLLARAAAAREAGRLDGGPDAALPLYQRVLALQPHRTEALEGREDVLADVLQQARVALSDGDLALAASRIARAAAVDPGHVDLPESRAALAGALDRRRAAADRDLRAHRLEAAVAGYQAVLAAAPDDAAAQAGVQQVAAVWLRRADRAAADFAFREAEQALARARALQASAPAVAAAEQHLAQARRSRARLPQAQPDPAQAKRVARLLADAARAEARGDLLAPPGESAFDFVRRARALAPDAPSVRAAMQRLLPAARGCFDDALRGNRLVHAQACLDARAQLGDAAPALATARTRLAQRWLAVGEERLRAGDLTGAARAEAAARALDPGAAGLAGFAQRLQAAGAGRQP